MHAHTELLKEMAYWVDRRKHYVTYATRGPNADCLPTNITNSSVHTLCSDSGFGVLEQLLQFTKTSAGNCDVAGNRRDQKGEKNSGNSQRCQLFAGMRARMCEFIGWHDNAAAKCWRRTALQYAASQSQSAMPLAMLVVEALVVVPLPLPLAGLLPAPAGCQLPLCSFFCPPFCPSIPCVRNYH